MLGVGTRPRSVRKGGRVVDPSLPVKRRDPTVFQIDFFGFVDFIDPSVQSPIPRSGAGRAAGGAAGGETQRAHRAGRSAEVRFAGCPAVGRWGMRDGFGGHAPGGARGGRAGGWKIAAPSWTEYSPRRFAQPPSSEGGGRGAANRTGGTRGTRGTGRLGTIGTCGTSVPGVTIVPNASSLSRLFCPSRPKPGGGGRTGRGMARTDARWVAGAKAPRHPSKSPGSARGGGIRRRTRPGRRSRGRCGGRRRP